MTDIKILANLSASQGKLDDLKKKLKRSERSSGMLAVAFTAIGVLLSIGANWVWWILVEEPSVIRSERVAFIAGMFCLFFGYICIFWVIRLLKQS